MKNRASFGKIGYILSQSISKISYGNKNPKKLKNAIKKASNTLDRLYIKYY